MKPKTEEDWLRIFENTLCAILNGRCSNPDFSNMSMNTLIDEAVWGADDLVEKLKKREEQESMTEQ